MEKKNYTVAVYSENRPGLLNRVTMLFVKRHINIESITVSDSEIKGISRYTIMVNCSEEIVSKIAKQIEKQIEVVRAYYHDSEDIISQEIALYKMGINTWNENNAQEVMHKHNAVVTFLNSQYVVIQKSGLKNEIDNLYKDIEPFGLMQFVRSGSIAISKTEMNVSGALK